MNYCSNKSIDNLETEPKVYEGRVLDCDHLLLNLWNSSTFLFFIGWICLEEYDHLTGLFPEFLKWMAFRPSLLNCIKRSRIVLIFFGGSLVIFLKLSVILEFHFLLLLSYLLTECLYATKKIKFYLKRLLNFQNFHDLLQEYQQSKSQSILLYITLLHVYKNEDSFQVLLD